MTWTKIGDEYSDWARGLSDAAFRTHTEALIWSNRRGLDLIISGRDLHRFAETMDPAAAVAELVASGWWEELPHGLAWYIGCHFPDWQVEKCVLEQRRKLHNQRQRKYSRHRLGDHSLCGDRCQE